MLTRALELPPQDFVTLEVIFKSRYLGAKVFGKGEYANPDSQAPWGNSRKIDKVSIQPSNNDLDNFAVYV